MSSVRKSDLRSRQRIVPTEVSRVYSIFVLYMWSFVFASAVVGATCWTAFGTSTVDWLAMHCGTSNDVVAVFRNEVAAKFCSICCDQISCSKMLNFTANIVFCSFFFLLELEL